jgi:hypothetical protein
MSTDRRRVVISYGLGVDSSAVLLRWLLEPATRPAPPEEWLVITAITGNEWPSTVALVTEHMLPLLASHGVRFVQVAKAGPLYEDGIVVLDDSRSPRFLHQRGPWALSDEMLAAGTVPQVAGNRKCSLKFKGEVIDRWLVTELQGAPFQHAIGFEASEAGRALRDARHNTGARPKAGHPANRTGFYPLIEWGWDREACERYIEAQLGVTWQKSACTFCPFALCNTTSRKRVLARYAADPEPGMSALVMEHVAVALNPRQGLAGGTRLTSLMAGAPSLQPVLDLFDERLAEMPWRLYEVRRAVRASGSIVRSVRTTASGDRDHVGAVLRRWHRKHGRHWEMSDHGGITRAWIRRRGEVGPSAEHVLVAAPAGAADKDGPGFVEAWIEGVAAPGNGLW